MRISCFASLVLSIFVRQKGQARYGSEGFSCRFRVFMGVVKTLLQALFGHVKVFLSPIWHHLTFPITYSLIERVGAYSVDESKIRIRAF